MIKQIHVRYKSLKPSLQLLVAFVFQSIFWLLAEIVTNKLTGDAESVMGYAFYYVWMGIFFTLLFNWTLVKKVFKKKTDNSYHQP